jgi:hypothetical protein
MNSGSWYWPNVDNLEGAEDACRLAMWCAMLVAGVTTLFAFLALSGIRIVPINGSALVDAAIFAAVAYGLWRRSRIAAVAGFVLFLIERVYMVIQTGSIFGAGVLGIVLLIGFLNGMRGAFSYHKLQSQPAAPAGASPLT